MKKVTVIIPCYNEAEGIAAVVAGFPRRALKAAGYNLEVMVVDNNSTDNTADIAREAGATVIHEAKKGKGNAIRTGFYAISDDTDYVVMLDGDDTYRPQEILRLLEPINSGFCNVVIGSRLGGRIQEGSMTAFNRLGNWIFSHLVRYSYRVNVTDVLTGYFAWDRAAIEQLRPHLKSQGFAIEMEMITKMARLGREIYSVPISYDARAGESNLHPVRDGSRILRMYLSNLAWMPAKPRPQRIAFVSDAIMPFNKGGKEKRLYEISKRLVGEGREVHIYTMNWWNGPETIEKDGVHLHAISPMYPLYANGRRSMRQAVLFGLATFKLLWAKFDVIDVDSMPFFPLFSARIVCWLRHKKLYSTWHEVTSRDTWISYLGQAGRVGYAVEHLAQMLPDEIIANSTHTASRLLEAGAKQPIRTVPLGVDLDQIHQAPTSRKFSDVIFAGRLLAHKNVDVLIRAIAELKQTNPSISCKIVGDGPERTNLEKLAIELGLKRNVSFVGFIEQHADLYSLMKASKVFALPSTREGFGLVVVEANAAGLPVITTQHPDNAAGDLIDEGVNGYLVELDAHRFAQRIQDVLTSRRTLRPRAKIEQYNWQEVARTVEKVLTA